jgi:hypothetical protein
MPEPLQHEGRVPMNGLVWTKFGLWHDLNSDEYEQYRRPYFAPDFQHTQEVIDYSDG